jgi:hypothetical protein
MTASQVVRVDAPQMLLPFAQQQARQNIYAAPFDAMAYSGLQINGAMDVSQEKGTNGTTVSNTWACDGWRLYFAGAMAVTAAQTSAIVSGFPASLGITVQTAQASLGAADVTQIYQAIEGYRIARLAWGTANAQPLTLGFWSAHHRPGLHSGTVVNGANNRSYAFTYTQAVADVPQYNVVTIPGDTTGVWKSDNTAGMNVVFAVACGSTGIAPSANTWLAGSYNAAPGQVNGVATTSDAFRLTGVTVLPGNEAPSAARSPFVMRSYDQELLTCQRYWEKVRAYMIAYGVAGAGQAGVSVDFLVEKRVVPTLAIPANGMFNCTFNTNTASTRQANMVVNVTATGTFIIDATFTCDARL